MVAQLRHLRLEHLWFLLVFMPFAILFSAAPTQPHDFWWHLRAGQLIASEGIPQSNIFSWGVPPETPYIYQSWLGEWLFYQIYQLGGFPLIVFARNLLATVAFCLMAFEAQRRSGSWRFAALALLIAGAMCLNNLTTRTQNWSWIPFMLTTIILGRYIDRQVGPQALIALPLIMIFWVNAHGAFIMGILVAGAFTAGETLSWLLKQPHALSRVRLWPLYAATGGMLAATLINPLGIGIFGYLQTLLGDPASQQLVIEWQTPDPRKPIEAAFYLGILATIASFAFGRRRPRISEVILICGLAWQSFIGVRYVVWFALAAIPIVVQSLSAPRAAFSSLAANTEAPKPGKPLFTLTGVLMLVPVLMMQPWFKANLPLPAEYQNLFVAMAEGEQLFTTDTPVAAVEHLRSEPCSGRIFNEMSYGSYMAWALHPTGQLAFIDPRIELYPFELWQRYIEISAGRDVDRWFSEQGVTCVLLQRETQARLVEALAAQPSWQRSFQDEFSEVWRLRR